MLVKNVIFALLGSMHTQKAACKTLMKSTPDILRHSTCLKNKQYANCKCGKWYFFVDFVYILSTMDLTFSNFIHATHILKKLNYVYQRYFFYHCIQNLWENCIAKKYEPFYYDNFNFNQLNGTSFMHTYIHAQTHTHMHKYTHTLKPTLFKISQLQKWPKKTLETIKKR